MDQKFILAPRILLFSKNKIYFYLFFHSKVLICFHFENPKMKKKFALRNTYRIHHYRTENKREDPMQLLTNSYKHIDILSPSEQILTSVDGNTSLSGLM
jgi:hypothetical protein